MHALSAETGPSSTTRPLPKLRQRSIFREGLDTLILIGAIYALVNLATARFIVQGPSMQPNFETGQFLIVSRVNYLLGEPQRGDIVVFHFPDDPRDDYIKRVIGLPGETVEIRNNQVYANGLLLNEPYLNEPCRCERWENSEENPWTLGPDEYFVMGDNRNHSSDSRAFGPVNRRYIVGEAVFRYWSCPENGDCSIGSVIRNFGQVIHKLGIVSQIGFPGNALPS